MTINTICTAKPKESAVCLFPNPMVLLILSLVCSLHPLVTPNFLFSFSPTIALYLSTFLPFTLFLNIDFNNPSTVLGLVASLVTPFLLPFSSLLVVSQVLFLLRCLSFNTLLCGKLLPCSLRLWRW